MPESSPTSAASFLAAKETGCIAAGVQKLISSSQGVKKISQQAKTAWRHIWNRQYNGPKLQLKQNNSNRTCVSFPHRISN